MTRILVIDDEPSVRELLSVMLTEEGYEVVEAADGEAGMRLFRENPADLVITDLIMPEKEGIETIMDLRRNFPDVKIIAMSGGGIIHAEDYLGMARGVGAHCVFEKPFGVSDLLKAVHQLLDSPDGS
jgi:DNA-binding response OmpR family regulator